MLDVLGLIVLLVAVFGTLWMNLDETVRALVGINQPDVGRHATTVIPFTVLRKSPDAEHWVGGGKGFAHPELSKTHTR
jgi:hypothetical protein